MGDDVTAVAAEIHPTFAHRAEYAALRGAVAAVERLSFTTAGKVGESIASLARLAPTPHTPGGPPIWGGGAMPGALKRAGRYFQGWFPSGPGGPRRRFFLPIAPPK